MPRLQQAVMGDKEELTLPYRRDAERHQAEQFPSAVLFYTFGHLNAFKHVGRFLSLVQSRLWSSSSSVTHCWLPETSPELL